MLYNKLNEEIASLKADPVAEPSRVRAFIRVMRGCLAEQDFGTACASLQFFVEHFPKNSEGYTLLARSYADLLQYERAIECFEIAIELDPLQREAFLGLATIYEQTKRYDLADQTWRRGFGLGAFEAFRKKAQNAQEEEPIRILMLASVLAGNLRFPLFMDDPRFQTTMLFAESAQPGLELPAHDIVFSVVGDSEISSRAVAKAQWIAQTVTAPLLNQPSSVAHTGREENARRLGLLENVVAPLTKTFDRELLVSEDAERMLIEHGFRYPFLMRSQGYSNGRFFEKIETQRSIAQVLEFLPGEGIVVIQYLNTMQRDGAFRKYRMMAIDRHLYPLHLAISYNWKVHYFSANMRDEQAFRDEEQAYLSDAPAVLGPKVMKALGAIVETLNLDYCGIDFAVNDAGEVVVFEANSNMEIVVPKEIPPWEYRRKPMQAALDAARGLIYGAFSKTR